MARNRIIYQSEALYVGPAPATGFHYGTFTPSQGGNTNVPNENTNLVKQLQRIQTANYSFNVERTDVNQFGQLAAIDRVILTNPTVSLDFSYLLANLANESGLGFSLNTPGSTQELSAISGILNKVEDERNYFIKTVAEGADAIENTDATSANNGVIGIGNAFITSYSTEASVGNFPTTTINVEGLNMNFAKGISGNKVPAVNPVNGATLENNYQLPKAIAGVGRSDASGISALRPGDIRLSLPTTVGGGADVDLINIQSYNLSFDLSRTPIERLGSKFAFSREIDFPVTVTLSVDAQLTDLKTGSIAAIVSNDSASYSPTVSISSPTNTGDIVAQFKLKGAKLDSQEFTTDIGANKAVTLTFSTQIGGPQDSNNGLFISGKC